MDLASGKIELSERCNQKLKCGHTLQSYNAVVLWRNNGIGTPSVTAASDIMYISSWACSNANLHTCTLFGQQRKPMNPSKATCLSASWTCTRLFCTLDAQRNANKGTEHPDERPLALLDTKNVLTKLLTSQTVSLYLTRAIGPLSSNKLSHVAKKWRERVNSTRTLQNTKDFSNSDWYIVMQSIKSHCLERHLLIEKLQQTCNIFIVTRARN